MYQMYPIYIPSARYSRENGEIALWRESFKINKECKAFIDENASRAYHAHNLPEFITELTDTFGLERSMYVIARSIVGADWDKRYYNDARNRAELFSFRDMKEAAQLRENGKDPYRTADNTTSLCSNVHPVMLNDIFRFMMKMEQDQVNSPQADIEHDNEHDEGVDR